jgi:hypothetical protein
MLNLRAGTHLHNLALPPCILPGFMQQRSIDYYTNTTSYKSSGARSPPRANINTSLICAQRPSWRPSRRWTRT